jgi:hypothetical protein
MSKRTLIVLTGLLATVLAAAFLLSVAPAAAQSEGRIAGIAYDDANGNGIREQGEVGLKDVRINFASAGWDTSINTEADGAFSIDLNPATWTVTVIEVPSGYSKPSPDSVEVTIENPGDTVTNLEFGLRPQNNESAAPAQSSEDTVLPESGSPIPGPVIVAVLVGLLVIGGALVLFGQRRGARSA